MDTVTPMTDQEAGHSAATRADRRLSTKEAAELLGVKPETVYAYVSRGQLSSRRGPGARGSTFDPKEVEALARRNRREPAAASGANELSVRTRITLIEKDRYYFRGVDAAALALRHSYEEVAEWLWTGVLKPGIHFTAPPEPSGSARLAVRALPEHCGPTDRLRVAAIAAGASDPLRFDLSEEVSAYLLTHARRDMGSLMAAMALKCFIGSPGEAAALGARCAGSHGRRPPPAHSLRAVAGWPKDPAAPGRAGQAGGGVREGHGRGRAGWVQRRPAPAARSHQRRCAHEGARISTSGTCDRREAAARNGRCKRLSI